MSVRINIQHRVASGFHLNVCLESESRSIGLTGPSGSGKTTFLHLMAGITIADHEHIDIDGHRLSGRIPQERHVGLAMQRPHLFPHMTVRQNLHSGIQNHAPIHHPETVVEWLEISELLDRSPRHLSGGECQRVALGRALLSGPRLLLLDEPLSAVDEACKRRIGARLKHHIVQQNMAMIMVSHDRSLLAEIVDHINIMMNGSILKPKSRLPQSPQNN